MKRTLAVVAVALVTGSVGVARGAEAQPPQVRFAESELATTFADLADPAKGAKVNLVNDQARAAPVRLRLDGPLLTTAAGAPIAPAQAFAAPSQITLGRAGSREVKLTIEPDVDLRTAAWSGTLVVYVPGARAVSRIPVTIRPTLAAAAVSAKPALSAMTVRSNARVLSYTVDGAGLVPIDVPRGTRMRNLGLKPGDVLGAVASDTGGTAVVSAGNGVASENGARALRITVTGTDGPGTYKGEIDTAPADKDAGKVALTVLVRGPLLAALAAMFLGAVVAVGVRRLRTGWVPLSAYDERIAQAEIDFAPARTALHEADGGRWSAFDTGPGFAAAVAKARKALKALRRVTYDELSAEDKKPVEAQVAALEAHVVALGGLAPALRGLEAALGPVRTLGPIPGVEADGAAETPAFVAAADKLLKGGALTPAQLTARLAALEAATDLAERWPELHAAAERAARRVAAADRSTPELVTAAEKAGSALRSAWTRLWEAPGAEAVEAQSLLLALEPAFALAAGLRGRPARLGARGASPLDGPVAPLAADRFARLAGGGRSPGGADPAQRLRRLVWTRRIVFAVLFLTAATAALYTGYQALYLGKAWGTWEDYLIAFLWGLTATTALDVVTQTLREIVAARPAVR